jgi:hypothetical protein
MLKTLQQLPPLFSPILPREKSNQDPAQHQLPAPASGSLSWPGIFQLHFQGPDVYFGSNKWWGAERKCLPSACDGDTGSCRTY